MKYEALILAAVLVGKIDLPVELKDGPELSNREYAADESHLTEAEYDIYNEYQEFCAEFMGMMAEHHNLMSCWLRNELDFNVPYDGAPTAVYYHGGWGSDQEVKLPPNPTILDVWKACDEAIRKSGDHHHVFIEVLDNDNGVLDMKTGS